MTTMTVTENADLMERAEAAVREYHYFQEAGLLCRDGDYVPSVHYPPITQYPTITEEQMFETYTMPEDGMLDVYAHIPFCEQRCVFCHYPVQLGHDKEKEKDRYLGAFEKEMDIYMRRLGITKIQARSILVGGGTPTFLTLPQMKRFLDMFCSRIDLSKCTQFNYDVEPGSLLGVEGTERLRMMRSYGVDRLTIGIQSLDDYVLKKMNRPHDSQIAIDSIENCMREGFQVNIEFIFGHPGETIENWIEVMRKAVSLGVHEIQLYRLKIEAYGDYQGPIIKLKQVHPDKVPSAEMQMMMKRIAIDILKEAGYEENIRRVYSKKREHYSHYAHNQCCLQLDEIGLGLTAFSSLRDRFVLNTQHFNEYYSKIEQGRLPLTRGYVRDQNAQKRWGIILPLKNRDVRKRQYEQIAGVPLDSVFRKKIQTMKDYGLVEETSRWLGLTERGRFFADECAHQFNAPEFAPFPRQRYNEGPLNPFNNSEP